MSVNLRAYTRVLKSHDKDLFCDFNKIGIPCIWRRSKRFVEAVRTDSYKILDLIQDKQFVFALTENWTTQGRVVHWGIDRVLEKVKSIDGFHNEELLKEVEKSEEKVSAAKQRDLRNQMEGFWSDQRSRFKEATKDILTHSMDKSEPNKRKREKNRRFKDGNS